MPDPRTIEESQGREYFRPSQAPEVIGVSRDTIYRWARQDKIDLLDMHGITVVSMRQIREAVKPSPRSRRVPSKRSAGD